MGWKTIVGGFMGTGSWLFQQDLSNPMVWLQAAGAVLGVVGVRHAIAKKK